jgi:hypothetical protein
VGLTFALPVRDWILELWPLIELDLGPEHLKIEKRRRARLAIVTAAIVLPILLRVLYDIVKSRL